MWHTKMHGGVSSGFESVHKLSNLACFEMLQGFIPSSITVNTVHKALDTRHQRLPQNTYHLNARTVNHSSLRSTARMCEGKFEQ